MVATLGVSQSLKTRLKQLELFVGRTPLYRLDRVYENKKVSILAKLEWQQLGNSVKARAALAIFKEAILSGKLREGMHLLDATSGNTGIAYATIGSALGVPVTLCLPENASPKRKQILKQLGAEIIYTSPFESTDGAQREAKAMVKAYPERYYYADQYSNHNNWKAHFHSTGLEIWEQTNHNITHFVAGLGTTGTFVGTSRRLELLNPQIERIALQPDNPLHGLEGWKHLETAMVPKIYDESVADQFHLIDTEEALDMVKRVAQKEGLLISPSAAANLVGAIKIAESVGEGTIVTTFADDASKYTE